MGNRSRDGVETLRADKFRQSAGKSYQIKVPIQDPSLGSVLFYQLTHLDDVFGTSETKPTSFQGEIELFHARSLLFQINTTARSCIF